MTAPQDPAPHAPLEQALRQLVDAFGGPTPLPAGGAAGIAALSMATALASKVLRISGLPEAQAELEQAVERAVPFFRADCDAYEALLAAIRTERQSRTGHAAGQAPSEGAPATRQSPGQPNTNPPGAPPTALAQAVDHAWQVATAIPVGVAHHAAQIEALLEPHRERIKPSVQGDYTAALTLIHAARQIATSNAHENAEHLAPETAQRLLRGLP